jgi:N6-L-threonylcarbamoyladenine synthase
MKILAIETSCDETSVAIINASGGLKSPNFNVLSHLVLSQVKIHEQYGGVFPNLAKREHSKNLGPLVKKALEEAGLWVEAKNEIPAERVEKIKADLSREPELSASLLNIFETANTPNIDLIAVTNGPGLEPALWVGINAAKVLSEVWNIPVMPINHMEGHISSVLTNVTGHIEAESSGDFEHGVRFPALALLISGGHTELVLVKDWLSYIILGETRDDAVGEVFDKVARMLGLPYPGGPQVSKLADESRDEEMAENPLQTKIDNKTKERLFTFPRPMIKSPDYDFSFSGLKTSVLYTIRDLLKSSSSQKTEVDEKLQENKKIYEGVLSMETKKAIAREFEDAIVETLLAKTKRAIDEYEPKSLIIAGGVVSNKMIRRSFDELVKTHRDLKLFVPTQELSTDNALMIAIAGYIRYQKIPNRDLSQRDFLAEGNLRLS